VQVDYGRMFLVVANFATVERAIRWVNITGEPILQQLDPLRGALIL
jgi:hypothetical protein